MCFIFVKLNVFIYLAGHPEKFQVLPTLFIYAWFYQISRKYGGKYPFHSPEFCLLTYTFLPYRKSGEVKLVLHYSNAPVSDIKLH